MAVVIPIETKYNPRGVKVAIRDLDDFKSAVEKAGGGFQGLATVTGKVMQDVGKKISNTGRTMSTHVTMPIVGLGIAAGVAFNAVDEGMDTVAARSGLTGKALEGLQGTFKNVAATSTQDMATIGEVVGAVGGKFQLTGKDAEVFSRQLLDLSRVTGVDATTTTEAVGEALTAFGLKANNAGGFLDTLLTASQRSNVGIDELAKTIAAGAPTFQTYGIGAQESTALVAALAGAGLPATRVVGGLNAAFKKLTEDGVKDLPSGLQDVLTRVRDMKDPTKATALAVEVFGSRVGVTMAEQVRSGKISVDELAAALDGSDGALERSAKAVEGPQEQFARLKNQLQLMAATFAEQVIPIIEQYVIPIVKRVIDFFNELDPSIKRVVVIAGVLAAAIGPLLMVLGSVVTAVGGIITVMGAVSAPVLAVVAAIGLVVGAVVLLWTKSEAFRDAVMSVWNMIRQAVARAVDMVRDKLEDNREQLDKLRDAFSRVWQFISQTLIPLLVRFYGTYLKAVITVLGHVVGAVIDVIGYLIDFGAQVLEGARIVGEFAGKVGERIGQVVTFFRELPGRIRTAIGNAGTMLLQTGRDIVDGLKNGLINAGGAFVGWVTGWMKSILPDPVERFLGISSPSKLFEGIGLNTVDGLVQGLDKGKQKVKDKAVGVISEAFEKVKEKVQEARDFGQGIADSMFDDLDMGKALEDAETTGGSIVDALNGQAAKSQEFANKMRQLLAAGLNEQTWTQIWGMSREQGMKVADAYLTGNTTEMVNRTNTVVASARNVADEVGRQAAITFRSSGINNAISFLEGLIEELLPKGKKRKALMDAMDDLAASLRRDVAINVSTSGGGGGGGGGGGAPAPAPAPAPAAAVPPSIATLPGGVWNPFSMAPDLSDISGFQALANIPFFADGGIVNRATLGVVGEAGPEAIIPLRNPGRAAGVLVEAGAVQVTVNGGDPREVQAAVERAFDDLVRELRAT